jgi:hypothetical protein
MPQFRPLHILPLLLGTTFTVGGAWPLWNTPDAIKAYGLPERIQDSMEAQAAFTVYGSRMTA